MVQLRAHKRKRDPIGSRFFSSLACRLRVGVARLGDGDADLLLANAARLAGELAEIEQLRAAHTATAHDLDVGEHRAVGREDALDANAARNLADGEGRADTTTA